MTFTDDPHGLAAGFNFELGFHSLRSEVRELRKDLRSGQARSRLEVPRDRREIFSGVAPNGSNAFPAAGNLILEVDGPQLGVIWEVKLIMVGGTTVNASPPGTAYVFACTAPPADLNLTMAKTISQTPFPVVGTWGTGVFKVRPPQNLYVVITGGTAGLAYAAVADINEYPDTPFMATVTTE